MSLKESKGRSSWVFPIFGCRYSASYTGDIWSWYCSRIPGPPRVIQLLHCRCCVRSAVQVGSESPYHIVHSKCSIPFLLLASMGYNLNLILEIEKFANFISYYY